MTKTTKAVTKPRRRFQRATKLAKIFNRCIKRIEEVIQIQDFHLLKNRATKGKSRLEQFHAVIVFRNDEQFGSPFREVSALGIHAGRHGFMIENVSRFVVEIFEEVSKAAPDHALRDAAPETP